MKFVDLQISPEGAVWAAGADGDIYARLPASDIDQQGLPPSQRRTHDWRKIAGPEGMKVTRVAPAVQGQVFVLGSGKLFERVRDTTAMYGEKWLWKEVSLG